MKKRILPLEYIPLEYFKNDFPMEDWKFYDINLDINKESHKKTVGCFRWVEAEMSRDDIIYAILLLLGISFGHFYRKIRDVNVKQVTGTAFGVALLLFTSKAHAFHVFFSFLVSCVIIKQYKS